MGGKLERSDLDLQGALKTSGRAQHIALVQSPQRLTHSLQPPTLLPQLASQLMTLEVAAVGKEQAPAITPTHPQLCPHTLPSS